MVYIRFHLEMVIRIPFCDFVSVTFFNDVISHTVVCYGTVFRCAVSICCRIKAMSVRMRIGHHDARRNRNINIRPCRGGYLSITDCYLRFENKPIKIISSMYRFLRRCSLVLHNIQCYCIVDICSFSIQIVRQKFQQLRRIKIIIPTFCNF